MRKICIAIHLLLPIFLGAHSLQEGSYYKQLSAIESEAGGRIGVSAIDTGNNIRIDYRANERFPVQSTMKMMVVANILKENTEKNNLLEKRIFYKKSDVVAWSPVTEQHLLDGMTIADLCEATMTYSDNTAANLLMKELGAPVSVTAFARSIGDQMFRLDNWEPHLNSNPENPTDTSTPFAMSNSLQKLGFEKILTLKSQAQLQDWMKANRTGGARIRAGVPSGWVVGDKTGSGDYGVTNDIGIIWPPTCQPIVLAIYYAGNKKESPQREDIIASVTRIVLSDFAKTDQCIAKLPNK